MPRASVGLAILMSLALVAGAAQAAERLVVEPYPAKPPWREVTNKSQGLRSLREYVPAGQIPGQHTDILAAQSFPGLPPTTPSAFLASMFARAGDTCEGVRVNGPKAAVEGGFAVAYGQEYCGHQKGAASGVNVLYKVIRGNDALYVINREFRVPASAVGGVVEFPKGHEADAAALMKGMSEADRYLVNSVYLCATDSTEKRCVDSAGR